LAWLLRYQYKENSAGLCEEYVSIDKENHMSGSLNRQSGGLPKNKKCPCDPIQESKQYNRLNCSLSPRLSKKGKSTGVAQRAMNLAIL
jgi:hypothetical protein